MKNNFTFNLGAVNVNIEGVPVNIENVNLSVDSEMTVAEMTQSFGMIKSIMDEIKSMMISSPSNTPVESTTVKTIKEPKKVINQTWDLESVWNVLNAKCESCFDEIGASRIRWTNEVEDLNILEEVEFVFGQNDIQMYVRQNHDAFWSYLYEDGSRSYCGIRNSAAKRVIESISDENVREIAMDFFNKVTSAN